MQKLPKVTINKLIKNLLDKNKNQTIFFFENKKISRIELLNKRNKLYKKNILTCSLLLSGSKEIKKLNKKFRKKI